MGPDSQGTYGISGGSNDNVNWAESRSAGYRIREEGAVSGFGSEVAEEKQLRTQAQRSVVSRATSVNGRTIYLP